MTISESLHDQLSTILYGQAWYGPPVYTIIDNITFEAAYQKIPGASHTIAEIIMHMLAWMEEVISRMHGNVAGSPASGDWPAAVYTEERTLQQLISNFKLANVELLRLVSEFPEHKWLALTNDARDNYAGARLNYQTMVTGLIQHHVYHAGQIAVLNKINNG